MVQHADARAVVRFSGMACIACHDEFLHDDSICSACCNHLLEGDDGTTSKCALCSCPLPGVEDFLCQECCEEREVVALNRLVPSEPAISPEETTIGPQGYLLPSGKLRV